MYPIASALRSQFNWTQYKLLIVIPDDYKREYYELEAINNCWTARELERQINSQLYKIQKYVSYFGFSANIVLNILIIVSIPKIILIFAMLQRYEYD